LTPSSGAAKFTVSPGRTPRLGISFFAMITWFQNTLGKHHKWILSFLLGITIITFVFTIGSVPTGRGGSGAASRMYLGFDLNDPRVIEPVKQGALETAQLNLQQITSDQQLDSATHVRMAMLYLADKWNIPQPSEAELQAYLKALPVFQKATGEYDPDAYASFRDRMQTQPAATREMVGQILRENCRLEHVRNAVSGPGYALPFPAQAEATLAHTKWDLDLATLSMDKFEPTIAASGDALTEILKTLYNRDPNHFEVKAAIKSSYVLFTGPPTTTAPTAEQLKDFVYKNPAKFPTVKPDDLGDKTAEVTAAWQKAQAAALGGEVARKFYQDLVNLNLPRNNPAFDALLKKYNASIKPLPALAQGATAPKDSPVPDEVMQDLAFRLSPQHTYSEPAITPDGAVVLFYDDIIPAHVPPFEEVRDSVLAYYKEQEKTKQFEAKGAELQKRLTQALADGKTFAEAATAAGLTDKNYPDFSFTNRPDGVSEGILSELANPGTGDTPYIATLSKGQVSNFLKSSTDGFFVFIAKRDTPALAPNSPEVTPIVEVFASREANTNLQTIISDLMKTAANGLKQPNSATATN